MSTHSDSGTAVLSAAAIWDGWEKKKLAQLGQRHNEFSAGERCPRVGMTSLFVLTVVANLTHQVDLFLNPFKIISHVPLEKRLPWRVAMLGGV